MRIAVNTRVLLKGRMEGVCRYIHETTKRIVLAHPEHDFFFLFDRPFHPSFIYATNITPIVIAPPTRDPILWKIWFDYSIPRVMKKYKIDVFLSGDTYASLRTEIPTVLVCHDLAYIHYPEHIPSRVLKYYQNNFPAFHEKAAQIIAVSQATKNDIVNEYSIDESKIDIAYNSVPNGFKSIDQVEKQHIRNKYTHGDPFFIYLGSVHPRKNVKNLVKAFEIYKSTNKPEKLVILGRKAWNFEEVDHLIQRSRYKADIVQLSGEEHNPIEILPAAEALCYISLFEGFGIPILEAMSSGVPVITSDVSSMPEVAGNAAIFVDPHDANAIAGGMKKLISDKENTQSLIRLGS